MSMNIGISEENRQKVAEELSKLIADEYVLFTKTKEAHWNVEGNDFYDKHKFFDEQAEQLLDNVDRVAERIRVLGFLAPANLKVFDKLTRLTENQLSRTDSQTFIKDLLLAHETIIIHLRKNCTLFADSYGDLGTSDFITGLMEYHEKTAWVLRTHLK